MKKLKLKALDLGANEILTRSQLKNVYGGGEEPAVDSFGGRYKCCWNDYPDTCSSCVDTEPNYTCASGSSAVAC
ncbi:hypothetical protein SAMN04488128_103401 [Chitinophaga eiseniae]|uniref:Natural product n=1 Tax=Chitinophaga eiseniae TaxID=634771 RepID=A0A1T4SS19_9BACT|nr:hypothetical protein [Chitinophaga eiseniae]SKA31054.1 hypothetical protein SAMN04488128_103401 [Chitinophaga eiseniae]